MSTDPNTAIRTPEPLRSLSGHDAYCYVCWEPVYRLWVDRDDDPAGQCMYGHKLAHECPTAMTHARNSAFIAKLRSQGLVD